MGNGLKFRIPNLDNKIGTATAKQARTLIEKNQPPGPEPGRANKLTKAQFVPAKNVLRAKPGRRDVSRRTARRPVFSASCSRPGLEPELPFKPQESASGHRVGHAG